MALDRSVISRIMSPQGRSGLNATCGYFLEEIGISSSVSFSSSFLREVACLALEALEPKRWMNSFSSLALSVFLTVLVLLLLERHLARLIPEVVIAYVELYLAEVDIRHMSTDLIEKVPVMGNDDDGIGKADEILFKPGNGL